MCSILSWISRKMGLSVPKRQAQPRLWPSCGPAPSSNPQTTNRHRHRGYRETALQTPNAHEREMFGLVEFGQQVDIGPGGRLASGDRSEHAQMHNPRIPKLLFMRLQLRYDVVLVHSAILAQPGPQTQCHTLLDRFRSPSSAVGKLSTPIYTATHRFSCESERPGNRRRCAARRAAVHSNS